MGTGADCAGQRGPWLAGCPGAQRWRFEALTRTRKLHQGTEPAACWSGQGWNQGRAAGGPCAPSSSWLLPLAALTRAIQSFIRNMQEQATIRRPGEIARLSITQLGLAGTPDLPNQCAQVHPKKARPAHRSFSSSFLRSGCAVLCCARPRYNGTTVPRVKLSVTTGWIARPTAQLLFCRNVPLAAEQVRERERQW